MKKKLLALISTGILMTSITVSAAVNGGGATPVNYTESLINIPAGNHDIPGILTLPKTKKDEKTPAVLMLHGTASNKDEVGNMYKDEAAKLADKGIASLRIDFAGSGDSKQDYSENFIDLSIADSQKALNYLLVHEQVDASNIGVLGFSQGGQIAQAVVAREPQVKALATWNTAYGNGRQFNSGAQGAEMLEAKKNGFVMVDTFRGPLKHSYRYYIALENVRALDELTQRYTGPILAVTGSEDTTVTPIVSEELIERIQSTDKTLYYVKGADHTFNVLTEDKTCSQETISVTADWFESKLK